MGRTVAGGAAHAAALRPEPIRLPLGRGVRRRRPARRDARLGRRAAARLAAPTSRHLRAAGGRRAGHRAHRAGARCWPIPVNRHPTVTASSIATIDELAPGRTLLGWGVGDTAVRLAGLRPARVKELEEQYAADARAARRRGGRGRRRATGPAAAPPAGADLDRRRRPAHAAHGRRRRRRRLHPGGDSRRPTSPGRSRRFAPAPPRPDAIRRRCAWAAIFHTVLVDDPARALLMGKSMAAGYYEYSPMLFEAPGLALDRPRPRDAQARPPGLARLPPRARSRRRAAASSTSCPTEPPTPSACAARPGDIVDQLVAVLGTAPVRLRLRRAAPDPRPEVPRRSRPRLHRASRARNPPGRPQRTRPLVSPRARQPRWRGRSGRRARGPRPRHSRQAVVAVSRSECGERAANDSTGPHPSPLQGDGGFERAALRATYGDRRAVLARPRPSGTPARPTAPARARASR